MARPQSSVGYMVCTRVLPVCSCLSILWTGPSTQKYLPLVDVPCHQFPSYWSCFGIKARSPLPSHRCQRSSPLHSLPLNVIDFTFYIDYHDPLEVIFESDFRCRWKLIFAWSSWRGYLSPRTEFAPLPKITGACVCGTPSGVFEWSLASAGSRSSA